MKTLFRLIVVCLAAGIIISCDKPEDKTTPAKVTVQLKWLHQAQFAGFYVAKENGLYARENLDVHLIEGGPTVDATKALIDGKADFAVMAPEDLIVRNSKGEHLKAIAAIYRRSAVVLLSHEGSGIRRPFDLPGKTVAVKGGSGSVRDFELQFYSMLGNLNIDPMSIKTTPYEPDFKQFLNKEIDVTATYMTGGLIRLRQQGLQPNIIWPGDYGVVFYSDILVTGDRMITRNPDIVVRFLRATLKGWQMAVGDPKTAVPATLKYAHLKDEKIQTAMLEALLPLVHTGEDHIGWMKKKDWAGMIQTLEEQDVISEMIPEPESLYTPQFLKTVYKQGDVE